MKLLNSLALIALSGQAFSGPPQTAQVKPSGTAVAIENNQVRVSYDLIRGTYDVTPIGKPGQAIHRAFSRWSEWSSRDSGFRRSWTQRPLKDALGAGKSLRIALEKRGAPKLFLDIELHDGSGEVVLNAGMRNTSKAPVRVLSFSPMVAAQLETSNLSKTKTLDAPSGALQTQVLDGPYRTSNNNLLLTMLSGGKRRSVVLGGLTYNEFWKTAASSSASEGAREAELGKQGKLAAYLDCGGWMPGRGLRAVKGTQYTFPGDPATPWFNTILFDNREVLLQADRLDPAKSYTLGLSWWDQNADGRRESVWVEPGDGGPRQRLLPSTLLPAWAGKRQPAGTLSVKIPQRAYASGRCRVIFTNDVNVPNAVVSEAWIWEGPVSSGSKPAASAAKSIFLSLSASDPVGRLLRPGETWFPDDRFYLDLTTDDPFLALERYGLALRAAQNCHPNPYDFPTVCAWYAGVWTTQGAQNHPDKSRFKIATTPGLVEEAEKIRDSGFLKYSRAAGRLVPDNYTANNPQGWWDDAHWQKEGFYVPPYETSQKWSKAMKERGVLAFTYFQPSGPLHSLDFRESHRSLLIGEDVGKLLDFTKPATQAYMRNVYANMRGAISGMMFDYCDEVWTRESTGGGFRDPHTTSAAFYRSVLEFGKSGLGPGSWIHERAIWNPGHDIALGISDSQRTSNDTDRIDPAMVAKSGLRWYKNRVAIAYDMDSKEINTSWKIAGYGGTDTDGRRMMLTMAYVAASRLLLANSFRDMSPEALYDLERTFPYPKEPRSARPIDAFAAKGWPQVYDFAVTPKWRVLTLYNALLPTRPQVFSVPLFASPVDGGLGLKPKKAYHVYDFWNARYVGLILGRDALKQTLREGEARVLAIHEAEPHPQFLSTNRHIGQGHLDMVGEPAWDPKKRTLSGVSKVVGGETYRVVLARNGSQVLDARAGSRVTRIKALPGGLAELSIDCAENATVRWEVRFLPRR
jgi:hypothetical protein